MEDINIPEEINIPYVKIYDEFGTVINPIKSAYVSPNRNRKERRRCLQKSRFLNNRKTAKFALIGNNKFKKSRQLIMTTDGIVNIINHMISYI